MKHPALISSPSHALLSVVTGGRTSHQPVNVQRLDRPGSEASSVRHVSQLALGADSAVSPPLAQQHQWIVDASVAVGGMLRAEAFTNMLRVRFDQPISTLARWIVDGRALSVIWGSEIMVPLFQFSAANLEPLDVVHEVIAEFEGVLGDWEILGWFVSPNVTLAGESPARRARRDPDSVRQVARLDRFIARGD